MRVLTPRKQVDSLLCYHYINSPWCQPDAYTSSGRINSDHVGECIPLGRRYGIPTENRTLLSGLGDLNPRPEVGIKLVRAVRVELTHSVWKTDMLPLNIKPVSKVAVDS